MAVFEAIRTTHLEADTAYIQWLSIPQTYRHLQIRISMDDSYYYGEMQFTLSVYLNADNNYSSFTRQWMRGSTSTASTSAHTAFGELGFFMGRPQVPAYGVFIIDILDYTNTDKNTTMSSINGFTGFTPLSFVSCGGSLWWRNQSSNGEDLTARVDEIMLHCPGGGGICRGSTATLYGLKDS